MPGLLIKDLPPDLHRKLKESAARHHRSLAKEALALLEEALAKPRRGTEPPRTFQGRVPLTEDLLDRARREARAPGWFRKGGSFEEEEEADREFWQQMTGRERVEVLEEMRRDAWKITGEPLGRLQRVVRVVERPWG